MTIQQELDNIFRAERTLREAEARLLATSDGNALSELFARAVDEARKLSDRREATLRLERLADLCAQVPGPRAVDALVAILDDEEPSVRVAAGEALLDVGYDRYAEVARAVERALERKEHGAAMSELPWILAEIGEPSALGLLKRFLGSKNADVVASAIEALASLGDPGAIPALEALASDSRRVQVDDEESGAVATIGELAEEAIGELGGDEEEDEDAPARA